MQVSRSAGGEFLTFCAIARRSRCEVIPGWPKGSGAPWVNCRTTRNRMALSAITETKLRFGVLDSWRGVAALLVALFHLNVYSAIYPLDFVRNGYLFVDFFFVLSGFVITYSYADRLKTLEDLGSFAIRRFGRLWPLHAVVLLAFVAAESAKGVMAARGASFYLPPFTGTNALSTIPMNLVFGQS